MMGKRRQRERREPKKEPAGSGRRIGWYVLAACAAVYLLEPRFSRK